MCNIGDLFKVQTSSENNVAASTLLLVLINSHVHFTHDRWKLQKMVDLWCFGGIWQQICPRVKTLGLNN